MFLRIKNGVCPVTLLSKVSDEIVRHLRSGANYIDRILSSISSGSSSTSAIGKDSTEHSF